MTMKLKSYMERHFTKLTRPDVRWVWTEKMCPRRPCDSHLCLSIYIQRWPFRAQRRPVLSTTTIHCLGIGTLLRREMYNKIPIDRHLLLGPEDETVRQIPQTGSDLFRLAISSSSKLIRPDPCCVRTPWPPDGLLLLLFCLSKIRDFVE